MYFYLRAKNSTLQSELTQAKEAKEKVAAQFSVFRGILNTFLSDPGQLPHIHDLDINSQESDEVASLISGLQKIKDSISASNRGQEGRQPVKIGVEDGQIFSIYTNRSNNLCVRDIEKMVGMRVVSLHTEVQQGGGSRQMKITGGYIACPPMGWGDRTYWVNKDLKSGSYLRYFVVFNQLVFSL